MKKIMFICAFLFSGIFLQAQIEDKAPKPVIKEQVGVNFTNFFLRFFSFNQPQEPTPSVLLYYKRGEKGKKWRYGFGGQLFRFNEENKDFTTFVRIDYTFGKEYYRDISKKWVVYFAWEGITSGIYSEQKRKFTNGNENKSWTRALNLGFQTIGGIQFQLNNRLSLLTETSYGLLFQYSRNEDVEENYTFRTIYSPPISLILSYHF